MRIAWDEGFSGKLENDCKIWLSEIDDLIHLKIPRYYFGSLVIMEKEQLQLHIFTDANFKAYGAMSYLRYKKHKQKFKTGFVMSKSRVAPLNNIILPHLELMGALIGARVAEYNKNVLLVSKIAFWTG